MQAAEDTPPVGEMAEQSKQTMKRLESLISESLQLYELDKESVYVRLCYISM